MEGGHRKDLNSIFLNADNSGYSTKRKKLIQMPPCPACGHGHGPYSYSYRLDRVSLRWRVVAGTFTRIFSTWDHSLRAIRSCCYWSFCGPIKCCQYCCLGCLGLSYFGWHEWYYHPPPVRKFYSSRKRRKRLNIQTMSDLLDEPEQHEPVREINLQQQTMVSDLFLLNFDMKLFLLAAYC